MRTKTLILVASILMTFLAIVGIPSIFTASAQRDDKVSAESVRDEAIDKDERDGAASKIVARVGQTARQQIESPLEMRLDLTNPTKAVADVDFVAFDADGREIGRETVTLEPENKVAVGFYDVFPELYDASVVEIQTSTRSSKAQEYNLNARQLPVAFFSQRDPRWKTNKLGTCRYDTIGSAGCAISSIAMAGANSVSNFNPASLNTYLTNNRGYADGCLVIWAAPANIDGSAGFRYLGSSTVGSAATMKSRIDNGQYAVVKSTRFPSHYGVIVRYRNNGNKLSDFDYLDPQDLSATFRNIGDGWVSISAAVQLYK